MTSSPFPPQTDGGNVTHDELRAALGLPETADPADVFAEIRTRKDKF